MWRLMDWVQARRARVFLAAILAGILAALGQAPFGLYPLAMVGLVAGFGLISAVKAPKRAAFVGWALGSGYFVGSLTWITQPFMVDAARHGWMAPFALVLMGGGLALFWALASGLAFRLGRGRYFWLVWAASMGLAELARGVVFTGFPWNGLGGFWVDTPLLALASLVGASGLSFLTFLFVAGIYRALNGQGWRQKTGHMSLIAGLVMGGVGFGLVLDGLGVPERVSRIGLRLIQPNAPQHLKWHPDYVLGFLERSIALTSAAPAAGRPAPDIVIWPEASVPYPLHDAAPVLAKIAKSAGSAQVILGILRTEKNRYYTSLVALDGVGDVAGLYDKHHLVPFGEYIPGGALLYQWFDLRGFAAQNGFGYSSGPGPQVLDLGVAGKILPLICYEGIFARNLHAAPERADWIVQITNDAWFGDYSGPQQHLAQARLRAAEFGLPMVRAANTGISAVIDARGHVVAQLGLGQAGFVDADLPAALPATLYSRLGDVPLSLLLIGMVLGLGVRRERNNV